MLAHSGSFLLQAEMRSPMIPSHYDQPQQDARKIVYDYVKDRLEKTDTHVTFGEDEVYVVWFSFILGDWKALISTTLPDGMYYEVTRNSTKEETYLDAYKKFDNRCIKDDSDAKIQELRRKLQS